VVFHQAAKLPAIAVLFENDQHHPVFVTSTDRLGTTGTFEAGDSVVFSASFENAFAPGRLYASPWVTRSGQDILDRRPRMTSVVVTGTQSTGGMVDLPHDVALDRADEAAAVEPSGA
jgi:Wzt C-terminal domain